MPTLPISQRTYLANPDHPSFVVGVPTLPTIVAKPVIGSPMMGPLVEFITNFWPFWDSEDQFCIADIRGGNNATVVVVDTVPGTPDIKWEPGKYGQSIGGKTVYAGDTILTNEPIVLQGGWSQERLVSINNQWLHIVTVNDPVSNTQIVYLNAVVYSTVPFSSDPLTVNDLLRDFHGTSGIPGLYFQIEMARLWSRPLENYEVTALAANPYMMFGFTQEILDEITTIINFMKPMRSAWSFIFD